LAECLLGIVAQQAAASSTGLKTLNDMIEGKEYLK
jgi:hypothetical protein